MNAAWSVFVVFLRLGLTSFGGPVAHLGYFRTAFVEQRAWVDAATYGEILGLCQFLPGPTSSQVGITLGLLRAGLPGALAAWCGFTLPSAVVMLLFGEGFRRLGGLAQAPWLHGLQIAAVAIVAQAVWTMGRSLCPDRTRLTLAVVMAAAVLAAPSAWSQIAAIAAGAVIGWRLFPTETARPAGSFPVHFGRAVGLAVLGMFFVLLAGLPLVAAATGWQALALAATFYQAGALVFGGGHVVLPLLQQAVVPQGWLSNDAFLAGYGAAQALPGPLFTFAAYLGSAMTQAPSGVLGGLICLFAIFLPAFLLVIGVLPFWAVVRERPAIRAALAGVNAAVVGLLLAALYSPVWTSAILGPIDFAIGLAAFLLLVSWRAPPWLVVGLAALTRAVL